MPTGSGAERGTLPLPAAFRRLGIGKTTGYRLVKDGRFPVPLVRVGARVVVPQAPLERLLAGDVAERPTDTEGEHP